MTSDDDRLRDLRREVDEVDDALHDLLIRRAEIVARIGATKRVSPDEAATRPAREAAIMRRLMARHHGLFPTAAVIRIWREIVAALTGIQGEHSVAVHAPEKSVGYWDLARDHFGSCTRMSLHRVASQVLHAVIERKATIGVLALPRDEEPDPWWRVIATGSGNMPRVFARLPFISNPAGRFEALEALAIARVPVERTGEDVSLLAVEATGDVSRARMIQCLSDCRLHVLSVAGHVEPGDDQPWFRLFEIADFVGEGDARVKSFADAMRPAVRRVVNLGGYAVPATLGTRRTAAQ